MSKIQNELLRFKLSNLGNSLSKNSLDTRSVQQNSGKHGEKNINNCREWDALTLCDVLHSPSAQAAADCSQKCHLIRVKVNNALLSEFLTPNARDRSAAAKCPQHLLPVSESSVKSQVSTAADLIWGQAPALAPSCRTQFNVTTPAQSSATSFSVQHRTSPAERQWQQQSVSYLLSLSLIPSLAAVPGICLWNMDLGSAVPTYRASLLFYPIERFSQLPGFLCMLSTPWSPKEILRSSWGEKKSLNCVYFCFCVHKAAFLSWLCRLGCAVWLTWAPRCLHLLWQNQEARPQNGHFMVIQLKLGAESVVFMWNMQSPK